MRTFNQRYAEVESGDDFMSALDSAGITADEEHLFAERNPDRDRGNFWDVPLSAVVRWRRKNIDDWARWRSNGGTPPKFPRKVVRPDGKTEEQSEPSEFTAVDRFSRRKPRTGYMSESQFEDIGKTTATSGRSLIRRSIDRLEQKDYPDEKDRYFFLGLKDGPNPGPEGFEEKKRLRDVLAAKFAWRGMLEGITPHPLLTELDHHPDQLCPGAGCMVRENTGNPEGIIGLRSDSSPAQEGKPNIGLVVGSFWGDPEHVNVVPNEIMDEHHKICGPGVPSKELCAPTYKVVGHEPVVRRVTAPTGKAIECPDCKGLGLETFSSFKSDGTTTREPVIERPGTPARYEDRKVLIKGGLPEELETCKECKGSGLVENRNVVVESPCPGCKNKKTSEGCETCGGSGSIKKVVERGLKTTCINCRGYGTIDKIVKPAVPPVYETRSVLIPEKPPVYKKCTTCKGDKTINLSTTSTEEVPGELKQITEPKSGECPFADHFRFCHTTHDPECTLAPLVERKSTGRRQLFLKILPFKWNTGGRQYAPYSEWGLGRTWDVPADNWSHLNPYEGDYLNDDGTHPFSEHRLDQYIRGGNSTIANMLSRVRQFRLRGGRPGPKMDAATTSYTEEQPTIPRPPKDSEGPVVNSADIDTGFD